MFSSTLQHIPSKECQLKFSSALLRTVLCGLPKLPLGGSCYTINRKPVVLM